jgi:hypothetical protein
MRHAVLLLTLAGSLVLAACGGDDKAATAPAASGAEARTEAAKTRAALKQAVAQLKAGDRKGAENTVSDGYLQHFEDVEGPLDAVDHELKEHLEDGIRGDLRSKIRDGAPVAEVERLAASLDADLAQAEQKLK